MADNIDALVLKTPFSTEESSPIALTLHVAQVDAFVSFLCSRHTAEDRTRIERVLSDHYDSHRQRWIGWPKHESPESFSVILGLLNSFCAETEFLPLEDGRTESTHINHFVSESELEGLFLNPVVICDELDSDSPITARWLLVLTKRAQYHLSRWIFLKQVYGIFISTSSIVFARFDRAGIILSTEISVDQDPTLVLQALFGCLRLAEDSLDTSISCSQGRMLLLGNEDVQSSLWGVEATLFHNAEFPGSGSRVLLVRDESNPGTQLVLKDWWRDTQAVNEGEVFRSVSGLFGLPRYHSHWTVCNLDGSPQTTHCISEDLQLHPSFLRDEDDEVYDFEADQESEGGATIGLERPLLIHSRLLMEGQGEHLLKFRDNPRIVLSAIHDAILGHWSLFQAGYLHDDVSYGNILVLPTPIPAKQFQNYSRLPVPALLEQCTAVLIDFGAAIPIADLEQGIQLERPMTKKGTLLYMSSWMSNGRKRYGAWAHDDLESFLWVLIVTAFWVKPPSPDYDEWYASVENTMKDCLFRDEPDKDDRIRDIKLSLMIAFSGETRRPFTYHDPVSSQYHEVIKKWCTYMLDRYFARMRRVQEYIVGDEQIYLDVLAILRESIESLS